MEKNNNQRDKIHAIALNAIKQRKEKRLSEQLRKNNDLIIKYFLKEGKEGKKYFDFCGAKLPDVSDIPFFMDFLVSAFSDTFLIPYLFGDSYTEENLRLLDLLMPEGPYTFRDASKNFDVTVNPGDVVIDAGAWIGDFSAYAASRGAQVYAFEPSTETFPFLQRTAELNTSGEIRAINQALADVCGDMRLYSGENSGNRYLERTGAPRGRKGETAGESAQPGLGDVYEGHLEQSGTYEVIATITLDEFVRRQNLKRLDFLKADIEGGERRLLAGAEETLRTFAPKLAICTYHLANDPEYLERQILAINPAYRVTHLRHKLFACVPARGH